MSDETTTYTLVVNGRIYSDWLTGTSSTVTLKPPKSYAKKIYEKVNGRFLYYHDDVDCKIVLEILAIGIYLRDLIFEFIDGDITVLEITNTKNENFGSCTININNLFNFCKSPYVKQDLIKQITEDPKKFIQVEYDEETCIIQVSIKEILRKIILN